MVGLLVRWILARYHVGTEAMHRVADQRGRVGIAAHKFGRWAEGQVQDVVEDEYLAIALRSSADADGWSCHFRRDHGGDFARNAFEINAGHTGAIECYRIAHELLDGSERLALHLVAAHHVHRLRSQPDVPGDGNLGVDNATD